MTTIRLRCEQCRKAFEREKAQQDHRIKRGMKHNFCSMACAGWFRAVVRSVAEQKARKAKYDEEYRAANRKRRAKQKAEWHRQNYDPIAARKVRKKRRAWHSAYIRRYNADPKRKAEKADYDLTRRASEYGPYADAFKLLLRLNREILKRAPNKYERLKARGYYDQGGRGWHRNELSKSRRAI